MKIEEFCDQYCDIDPTDLCDTCYVKRVLTDMNKEIERMKNCKNCKFGWSTEECIMPEGECIGRSEWEWME